MMAWRGSGDRRIFFPWESRGGLLRWLGLGRMRKFVLVFAVFAFVVFVAVRERRRSGIRQTQATLLDLRALLDGYLADHDGSCPANLASLTENGNFKPSPNDAWGRPLRLICPATREGIAYELMSDGPDGKPGGLDRIE